MCSTREIIDVLPLLEEQEIERTFNETQGYVATKKTKKKKNFNKIFSVMKELDQIP